jgi:hypothetical protein
VAVLTIVVKGLISGNLGVLRVAVHALLDLLTLLPSVVANLTVLRRVGMLFVAELNSLIPIALVMLRIIDGDDICLTKDALQNEQGSEEHKGYNNGNELSVH